MRYIEKRSFAAGKIRKGGLSCQLDADAVKPAAFGRVDGVRPAGLRPVGEGFQWLKGLEQGGRPLDGVGSSVDGSPSEDGAAPGVLLNVSDYEKVILVG